MSVAAVAAAHYRRQATLAAAVTGRVLGLWRGLGPSGFRDAIPAAAAIVAAGQLAAAHNADTYTRTVVAEQGVDAAPAILSPGGFAGVTAAGFPLQSALNTAPDRAWELLDAGVDYREADLAGQARLSRIVSNEVQQASTNAEHAAITADPRVSGYVRMLTPPSCGRCTVLAGRRYRWSSGFQRHDNCDCRHVPAVEAEGVDDLRTDPMAYFNSLSDAEQAKLAGNEANAQAVRDGADLSQVVNTSRRTAGRRGSSGLYEYDGLQYTHEGATVRQGRAGRLIAERQGMPLPDALGVGQRVRRLTPRSIYQLAGNDRDLAVQLLRDNGYIRDAWTPDFRRSLASVRRDFT